MSNKLKPLKLKRKDLPPVDASLWNKLTQIKFTKNVTVLGSDTYTAVWLNHLSNFTLQSIMIGCFDDHGHYIKKLIKDLELLDSRFEIVGNASMFIRSVISKKNTTEPLIVPVTYSVCPVLRNAPMADLKASKNDILSLILQV